VLLLAAVHASACLPERWRVRTVARPDVGGRYVVSVRPDLPGWTWWLVGGPWVLLALGHTLRERRTLHPA